MLSSKNPHQGCTASPGPCPPAVRTSGGPSVTGPRFFVSRETGPPAQVQHSHRGTPAASYGFVASFSFVGTMLLICGAILILISSPYFYKKWSTATTASDGTATGTETRFPGVPIGVALLGLGIFAYVTAFTIHFKENCTYAEDEDASHQNGDATGSQLQGNSHVPAVMAITVRRPYTEILLKLVPLASYEESAV